MIEVLDNLNRSHYINEDKKYVNALAFYVMEHKGKDLEHDYLLQDKYKEYDREMELLAEKASKISGIRYGDGGGCMYIYVDLPYPKQLNSITKFVLKKQQLEWFNYLEEALDATLWGVGLDKLDENDLIISYDN